MGSALQRWRGLDERRALVIAMDEHQRREIFQKARAIVDSREQDAWEHRRWQEQHRDRYGILNLGQDEEIEQPPQQQRSSDEMVYKTYAPAQQQPPLPDAQIFNDKQGEALVYVIVELRAYTREYVDQKLGELRAEIEVLSGVLKNNNVELIKKRDKNVA